MEEESGKPVVISGDLNVALDPIDVYNHFEVEGTSGYTIEERESFERFLKLGFVDTFRHFNPGVKNKFTFWNNLGFCKKFNKGLRIDYFLISKDYIKCI